MKSSGRFAIGLIASFILVIVILKLGKDK